MGFLLDKENILRRIDKSRIGAVDRKISRLVRIVNKFPGLVTTSSCSGRIVLIDVGKTFKKIESVWLFCSHDAVGRNLFPLLKNGRNIWLKMEGAILHVKCATIEDAHGFIQCAKNAGFKRTGAISMKEPFVIEMISSEQIMIPLTKNGKVLAEEKYLKQAVKIANTALKRNENKMKKLETCLSLKLNADVARVCTRGV